ncbi:RM49-like protein [Mya arenaria]|uniref:Large ribosomal subunit protein mL49 n=1 Tax=Mya arenaria TaxID=6604 RepID=A0ABY7FDZ6_MYAAR|nr:39S ribosomal protein L49, mitochondrial-like [Mya arenaria]WAR19186.1 RM49-like protein [Mya arenaria]
MAAPLVRSFRALGQNFLQHKHQVRVCSLVRLARSNSNSGRSSNTQDLDAQDLEEQDPNHFHDYTAPYFPEETAKRSLQAEYPDVEISTAEWEHVERILPQKTVPYPPEHEQYPTPSGWVPPNEGLQPSVYGVHRTRNHMLPVYYRKHFHGRETTKIRGIYGDIWKLRDDAGAYLLEKHGKKVDIQVHEVGRFIRFRGNHLENVAKFLLDKGF